jgi:hypothetical protein
MRRRRHAPPRFPEKGCRAVVRAPRWYRPASSGLKGASRFLRKWPAATRDPGDLWRATGSAQRAGPRGCPVSSGALPRRTAQPLAGLTSATRTERHWNTTATTGHKRTLVRLRQQAEKLQG